MDGDAVAWCRPSPHRGYATACGDGSLIAVADRTLVHIGPDARPRAIAFVPEGAAVCTPPAIDPEGRVFVGAGSELWIWE